MKGPFLDSVNWQVYRAGYQVKHHPFELNNSVMWSWNQRTNMDSETQSNVSSKTREEQGNCMQTGNFTKT